MAGQGPKPIDTITLIVLLPGWSRSRTVLENKSTQGPATPLSPTTPWHHCIFHTHTLIMLSIVLNISMCISHLHVKGKSHAWVFINMVFVYMVSVCEWVWEKKNTLAVLWSATERVSGVTKALMTLPMEMKLGFGYRLHPSSTSPSPTPLWHSKHGGDKQGLLSPNQGAHRPWWTQDLYTDQRGKPPVLQNWTAVGVGWRGGRACQFPNTTLSWWTGKGLVGSKNNTGDRQRSNKHKSRAALSTSKHTQ